LVVAFLSGSSRFGKNCRKLGLRALPIDKGPKIWWSIQQQPLTQASAFAVVAIPIHGDDLHTIIPFLQRVPSPHPGQFSGGFSRDVFKANNHGKVIVHKDWKHGQDHEMCGSPGMSSKQITMAKS